MEDESVRAALARLGRVKGSAASWLQELSFVTGPKTSRNARSCVATFTIVRESGHTDVAHLFNEDDRRLKD